MPRRVPRSLPRYRLSPAGILGWRGCLCVVTSCRHVCIAQEHSGPGDPKDKPPHSGVSVCLHCLPGLLLSFPPTSGQNSPCIPRGIAPLPSRVPLPRSLVHPQHRSPAPCRCSPGTCPCAPSEGDVGIPGTGQLQGDAGFAHTHCTSTSPPDRHQRWPLAPSLPPARCARNTPGRSRLFLRTSPAQCASAGSCPGSCTAVACVAPRLGGGPGLSCPTEGCLSCPRGWVHAGLIFGSTPVQGGAGGSPAWGRRGAVGP